MLKIFLPLAVVALCAHVGFFAFAQDQQQIVIEDFASDPALHGWRLFGNAELLRRDVDHENLAVTWDSSRPNSYLRLPLGTIMTRRDDFDVSLDLYLEHFAAGIDPLKPGTFQLTFGFQNFHDASQPTFLRAAPNAAPNLVEFNFMPDTGFGPTVWPAVMSTNGAMNYSGASDFSIFDLPLGVWMQISLTYRASNETATITVATNGTLVGPITTAHLATNDVAFGKRFTQFKVDTFAITSYSDAGQSGPFSGSLLADGAIDNIVVKFPPPPIRNFSGRFQNVGWEATFLSRTNWTYRLQSSGDLQSWLNLADAASGTGDAVVFRDGEQRPASFYRIAAQPVD